jgi:hypothetical protein
MSLYTAFERNMAMNKVVIPAILGAVVLVAGVFAFMPVQRAQTVHTSIVGNIDDVTADLANLFCVQWFDDTDFAWDPDNNECFDTED